jgi:hypothetical protein
MSMALGGEEVDSCAVFLQVLILNNFKSNKDGSADSA